MTGVRLERFVGKLGLCLFGLTVLVVLADFLGPVVSPLYRKSREEMREKLVAMAPVPYSMTGTTFDEGLRAQAKLNRLGFRGEAPSAVKPKGERWIFLLGGSTVYYGKPTLAELMEEEFRRSGHQEIRCFNFGVPTSLLRSDIARYLFWLSEFQPDLLLFYGLGNDVILPFQGDSRPGFPFNFVVYENNPLYVAGTEKANILSPFLQLLYQSTTLRVFFGPQLQAALLPRIDDRERVLTEEWSESILQTTIRDVYRVQNIGKGFSVPVAIVFQPLVYYRPHPTADEKTWIFPELGKHAVFMRQGLLKEFLKPELKNFFFDLSGVLDGEAKSVFLDGIHIHQEYFDPIAKRLATIALPLVLSEPKASPSLETEGGARP